MRAEAKIVILQKRVTELENLLRRASHVLPDGSLIDNDVRLALSKAARPGLADFDRIVPGDDGGAA